MNIFYITTLGCKVNQYESDGIAAELVSGGWTRSETAEKAKVCIINTCAVTSRAAMQSRQLIRSIIRSNADARIIVTGCHAQTAPEEIKKIENVDLIAGHRDKFSIARHILSSYSNKACTQTVSDYTPQSQNFNIPLPLTENAIIPVSTVQNKVDRDFVSFAPAVTGTNTRAYLKIQDGCNAFCSYCIVPYARGRSRSMPSDEIMNHLSHLSSKGYSEAILTGIHIGAYGLDFEKKGSITELLLRIEKARPIYRVRLSSIEPAELTDEIIALASGRDNCDLSESLRPVLCDHFHIPLQSGDNSILERMGRPYNSDLFRDLVLRIRQMIPSAAIGADVLVGFPGESDEAFRNTFNLLEKLPITYLHVFPFSPRKGTPAFGFPDKIDTAVVKKRCAALRKLSAAKREQFESGLISQRLEAIIQETRDDKSGMLVAVTSNYLSILVDGDDDIKKNLADIELTGRDRGGRLKGKIVS